jgi:hypothetical protein
MTFCSNICDIGFVYNNGLVSSKFSIEIPVTEKLPLYLLFYFLIFYIDKNMKKHAELIEY